MRPALPSRLLFTDEGKGAPMTKAFACLLLTAMLAAGRAPVACAAEIKTETGRLQELIAVLTSRDYVLRETSSDPRPYVDPSGVLNAFRHMAAALAWGDLEDAARKAAKLDYELVKFTDERTHHEYYVLREDLSRLDAPRGWGSYILNPNPRVDVLVEAPHPLADAQTPEIGGLIFEQAGARGYLLAGAHREKADVPDLVDSVFHQVHAAWVGPAAQVAAWQIHGFVSYKHEFPRGVHVVASAGDGVVEPELANLDAMLEEQGLASYVFNDRPAESRTNRRLNGGVPGVTFTSLAATDNEQGRHSRSLGGSFVHVELESGVRLDESQRETAAAVIAAAMSGSSPRTADADDGMTMLASLEMDLPGDEADDEDAEDELAVEEDASLTAAAGRPARTQPGEDEGDSSELP
jgi:hypothetical protein